MEFRSVKITSFRSHWGLLSADPLLYLNNNTQMCPGLTERTGSNWRLDENLSLTVVFVMTLEPWGKATEIELTTSVTTLVMNAVPLAA